MAEKSESVNSFLSEVKGGDRLQIEIDSVGSWKLSSIACSELKLLLKTYKEKYGAVKNWPVPIGENHSDILLREVLLKAHGQWIYPTDEEEICHCRKVSKDEVDQAIILGCHKIDQVRRVTSANTACGTCQPLIEKMIGFRLKQGSS